MGYPDRTRVEFEIPKAEVLEPQRTERLLKNPWALRRDSAGDSYEQLQMAFIKKCNGDTVAGIIMWITLSAVNVALAALSAIGNAFATGSYAGYTQVILIFSLQLGFAFYCYWWTPDSDRVTGSLYGAQFFVEGLSTTLNFAGSVVWPESQRDEKAKEQLFSVAFTVALVAMAVPMMGLMEKSFLNPFMQALFDYGFYGMIKRILMKPINLMLKIKDRIKKMVTKRAQKKREKQAERYKKKQAAEGDVHVPIEAALGCQELASADLGVCTNRVLSRTTAGNARPGKDESEDVLQSRKPHECALRVLWRTSAANQQPTANGQPRAKSIAASKVTIDVSSCESASLGSPSLSSIEQVPPQSQCASRVLSRTTMSTSEDLRAIDEHDDMTARVVKSCATSVLKRTTANLQQRPSDRQPLPRAKRNKLAGATTLVARVTHRSPKPTLSSEACADRIVARTTETPDNGGVERSEVGAKGALSGGLGACASSMLARTMRSNQRSSVVADPVEIYSSAEDNVVPSWEVPSWDAPLPSGGPGPGNDAVAESDSVGQAESRPESKHQPSPPKTPHSRSSRPHRLNSAHLPTPDAAIAPSPCFAHREAAEQMEQEARAKAQQEAEEKAQREAEERAERAARTKAKRAAEEKAKREAEREARREARAKAQREAEDKAEREAAEKAAKEEARREKERTREEMKQQRAAAKQAACAAAGMASWNEVEGVIMRSSDIEQLRHVINVVSRVASRLPDVDLLSARERLTGLERMEALRQANAALEAATPASFMARSREISSLSPEPADPPPETVLPALHPVGPLPRSAASDHSEPVDPEPEPAVYDPEPAAPDYEPVAPGSKPVKYSEVRCGGRDNVAGLQVARRPSSARSQSAKLPNKGRVEMEHEAPQTLPHPSTRHGTATPLQTSRSVGPVAPPEQAWETPVPAAQAAALTSGTSNPGNVLRRTDEEVVSDAPAPAEERGSSAGSSVAGFHRRQSAACMLMTSEPAELVVAGGFGQQVEVGFEASSRPSRPSSAHHRQGSPSSDAIFSFRGFNEVREVADTVEVSAPMIKRRM